MLDIKNTLVSVNGKIDSLNQSLIPISDRGFLFGEAVVEVLKIQNSGLQNFAAHMERLMFGCQQFKIGPILKSSEILADIKRVYAELQSPQNAYVKIIVTSGQGITIKQAATTIPSLYTLITRMPLTTEPPTPIRVKALELKYPISAFKNNHLAWRTPDSRLSAEFDDCLYVDKSQKVLCLSTANIFLVRSQKEIWTPRLGDILNGTTRGLLLKSLKKQNYKVVENDIYLKDLNKFTGAIACSSIREIVPVCTIDEKYNYEINDLPEMRDYYFREVNRSVIQLT